MTGEPSFSGDAPQRPGQRALMPRSSTREKTIEKARNRIEVHHGASPLVANNHVTTRIPTPYTARKAEKSSMPLTTGLDQKRPEPLASPMPTRGPLGLQRYHSGVSPRPKAECRLQPPVDACAPTDRHDGEGGWVASTRGRPFSLIGPWLNIVLFPLQRIAQHSLCPRSTGRDVNRLEKESRHGRSWSRVA